MSSRVLAASRPSPPKLQPHLHLLRSPQPDQRRSVYVNGHYQTTPHAWDAGYPVRPRPPRAGDVRQIGVIGGGLTGLAAAYELARQQGGPGGAAEMRVTLLEASGRLGGWVGSRFVDVPGGRVLFESGPRTLRASGSPHVLGLVDDFNLYDQVLTTPRSAAAARNRYVLLGDRLVRMPSGVLDAIQWLFGPANASVKAHQYFIHGLLQRWPKELADASIAQLVGGLFNLNVERIASAVIHGIYAGDAMKLSAAALMPSLFRLPYIHGRLMYGLVKEPIMGMLGAEYVKIPNVKHLGPAWGMPADQPMKMDAIKAASVYSFKQGIGQLVDALKGHLLNKSNVAISTNTPVTDIEVNPGRGVNVKIHNGRKYTFDQVICTLPSQKASNLISAPYASREDVTVLRKCLTYNPSVSVMVVNMYFEEPNLLPIKGFGYLIEAAPHPDQNPEGALGVVFDSDAIQGQDEVARPGTKLTVMLGGHQWDVLKTMNITPTEKEGIQLARDVIRRHLGITAAPVAVRATLQKDCIPQYLVGHRFRMARLASILTGRGFEGDLMVGGSSYTGVSVDDCLGAGFNMARMVKMGILDSGLMAPTETPCERIVSSNPFQDGLNDETGLYPKSRN